MTYADFLKAAGRGRTPVLQEFRLQHNPSEERIHAFCEGQEDTVFYRKAISKFAKARPVFFYVCDGKTGVIQAFNDVTTIVGNYRHTLYFLDKDLSDLVPEA